MIFHASTDLWLYASSCVADWICAYSIRIHRHCHRGECLQIFILDRLGHTPTGVNRNSQRLTKLTWNGFVHQCVRACVFVSLNSNVNVHRGGEKVRRCSVANSIRFSFLGVYSLNCLSRISCMIRISNAYMRAINLTVRRASIANCVEHQRRHKLLLFSFLMCE